MPSVSFDVAAHNYDATRGFPPGVADLVARLALELLGPVNNALEVGVGTGRIARPLLARALPVTGLDLSRKMMQRLLAAVAPNAGPPLVQAAAEFLPFPASSFDAVISVQVFHLLAGWVPALAEVRRVLRDGGSLLIGYESRPPDSPGARLMERWRKIVRARGLGGPARAAHDFDDIQGYLVSGGAEADSQNVGQWSVQRNLAQHLEAIEHRTWSSTWHVPDDFFTSCLTELRGWAIAEFSDLQRVYTVPHEFVWQRYRWP